MSTEESNEFPRLYDAHAAAERYYAAWEAEGHFVGDPTAPGDPFVIVIPPPNVTGSLHMGHALDNTLQDILIRYKRMDGYNTVWIPGTDHAGIATQWIVEKQLAEQGKTRHDLGRDAFLERVWAWKEESGGRITHQLRKLGVSCDWSRERFTMDEGLSKAVREVFVRLYEQGLIYRDTRLINWDPVGQTALSELEVDHEEGFQGQLWSFAYPLADGSGEIVVATTRPETMLGDTAVAVHPEDPRYKHLIGKKLRHPLVDREFPIVADAILVDPEFGTGAVKVTPAHDPNDYEVGKRHDLPFINILNTDATINAEGAEFEGLDRFDARKAVKEKMAELGFDRGTEKHLMSVGRSQRSGAIVEPMISTQWFVRMKPLAAPSLGAVENGYTRFVPSQWENTYYAWMRDIRDWCISRQLWWGHQIPAWHCGDCGHTTVAREDVTACESCGGTNIEQDVDVLDTWFSSALWPFSVMGWPEQTPEFQKWYPTSVLVTGFDIIFFWVARMIFSGVHHTGSVPFADVCIHGLIRDKHGQKMSKTKGNVVDPLDTIEKYGNDAFRFVLAHICTQGNDMLWNDERVDVAKRFTNKIWQAYRFLHMNLGDDLEDVVGEPESPSVYDHWIRARMGAAVGRVRKALDEYRFNDAASEIYAFTWDELCDWYLELVKGVLYGDESEEARRDARRTLVEMFGALARLAHPIMPFLTEEIWQRLPGTEGTVMLAEYPRVEDYPADAAVLEEIRALQDAINTVRRIRAESNIAPKVPLALVVDGPLHAVLEQHQAALANLANVQALSAGARPEGMVATGVVGESQMYIPLDDAIDLDAEKERLERELATAENDVKFLEKRLSNKSYVERAPSHLVEETRGKLAAAQAQRDRLADSLARLTS